MRFVFLPNTLTYPPKNKKKKKKEKRKKRRTTMLEHVAPEEKVNTA